MNDSKSTLDTTGSQLGLEPIDLHKRPGRIAGIFKQRGLCKKLDFIFYRTLCPRPDGSRIGMWWYGVSARIAGYFHAKHCKRCETRQAQQMTSTAELGVKRWK